MALINPVYTFVVPFMLVVTAPLAIFAGITTVLAFSVLSLRVLVAYLDIALSIVPQCLSSRLCPPDAGLPNFGLPDLGLPDLGSWILPPRQRRGAASQPASPALASGTNSTNSSSTSAPTVTPLRQQSPLFVRSRCRRPSSAAASIISPSSDAVFASEATAATATAVTPAATPAVTPAASALRLGLVPSLGPQRDYEGIGGWRSGRDAAENDDRDAWTTFNSRFEFPDRSYARSRHRSPSTTPGEGGVLMMRARARSPNQGGAVTPTSPVSPHPRTPSASRVAAAASDSYFPLTMSPAAAKRGDTLASAASH